MNTRTENAEAPTSSLILPTTQKRPVWVHLDEQRRILWSKAEALGRTMHQKWSLLSERSLLTLQEGGVREAEVDATLALFTSARRERERDLAAFQRVHGLRSATQRARGCR